MIVKGKLEFIEDVPARDNYKGGKRLQIVERRKDGKIFPIDVFTDKPVTVKVGENIEMFVIASSKSGIFYREG